MSHFIECTDVVRRFKSADGVHTTALDKLSITFTENEFICLLGPSGCGKTTLLNLIAGFIHPTQGEIRVGGKIVNSPGPDRGVVFQDYSLFSWLTVRANVEFGLRMAGKPAKERHRVVDHYLSLVGLSNFADKYPFELSGGMKQRVAIARSLATRPKVLLMDEPFAALDAMTRDILQSELFAIQRAEKKTIIFVTHNISEAIFLADRIIVMSSHPGRVKEIVNVDIPRPRGRTTNEFNNLYNELENAVGHHVAG